MKLHKKKHQVTMNLLKVILVGSEKLNLHYAKDITKHYYNL
jgi:hypothetical protein